MGIFSNLFGDKNFVDVDNKVDELVRAIPSVKSAESAEDSTGKIIDSFLSH